MCPDVQVLAAQLKAIETERFCAIGPEEFIQTLIRTEEVGWPLFAFVVRVCLCPFACGLFCSISDYLIALSQPLYLACGTAVVFSGTVSVVPEGSSPQFSLDVLLPELFVQGSHGSHCQDVSDCMRVTHNVEAYVEWFNRLR